MGARALQPGRKAGRGDGTGPDGAERRARGGRAQDRDGVGGDGGAALALPLLAPPTRQAGEGVHVDESRDGVSFMWASSAVAQQRHC